MARIDGKVLVSKWSVNCWGCGDQISVGEDVFQGDDDHNYCMDYCADLTAFEIEANAREWAKFNGVAH